MHTRGGLSRVPELLGRLPRLAGRPPADRVLTLVAALEDTAGPETHTTNLVAVDADGRACVLTSSLGLGAGVWTPGFDLHLNSMLGERDLVVGSLASRGAHGVDDGADDRARPATGLRLPPDRPAAPGCGRRS